MYKRNIICLPKAKSKKINKPVPCSTRANTFQEGTFYRSFKRLKLTNVLSRKYRRVRTQFQGVTSPAICIIALFLFVAVCVTELLVTGFRLIPFEQLLLFTLIVTINYKWKLYTNLKTQCKFLLTLFDINRWNYLTSIYFLVHIKI